jgi:hypothetical protein
MGFKISGTKIISDTPCPHCNKQSTYKLITRENDLIHEPTLVYDSKKFYFPYKISFQIYQCEHCDRYRLIIERIKSYQYSEDKETILEFPFPGFSEIDREKIKSPVILENLDEGMRCLAANSPKGAIVNFRRALQAAVLILGAEGDDLYKQIDDLYKKELIRAKTRDIAHKIRAFGNLGAHPFEIKITKTGEIKEDNFSNLTLEDALQAAKMLVLFLEDAFIYPSKLESIDKRLEELDDKQ